LHDVDADVAAVVTMDDPSSAAQTIRDLWRDRATLLSFDNLMSSETLASLASCNLDLGIAAWWPKILRPKIFNLPRLGTLNLHPSLLPHNRGKHSSFWSIVERCPFGVSIHFIDDGIDTGDVAFQRELPITWADTGRTLYERALSEIVRLFQDSFPTIQSGQIPRSPQSHARGSMHYAREIEEASRIQLDEHYRARDLLDLIRARDFPGRGAAWFTDGSVTYNVTVTIQERGAQDV
jgi:methionyl-tRNA formyltransferase